MSTPLASSRKWLLAFSMTEIMAVSAIVTSIPAAHYARAQQKALETKCRSNLQQIGQLIVMYHMTNGVYPDAVFYPEKPLEDEKSIVRVMADGGTPVPAEMWICPAAPEELRSRGLTFVYNEALGGRRTLRDPSRAWLLTEVNCVSRRISKPHPGGYNVLCADGHVVTTQQLPPDIKRIQTAALPAQPAPPESGWPGRWAQALSRPLPRLLF